MVAMLHSKLLIFTSLNIFAVSFLVSYFEVDLVSIIVAKSGAKLPSFLKDYFHRDSSDGDNYEEEVVARGKPTTSSGKDEVEKSSAGATQNQKKVGSKTPPSKVPKKKPTKGENTDDNSDQEAAAEAPSSGEKVFTKTELAGYDGGKKSKGLCLAVLGKVYDVSKGKKHYGPGGGYHGFAGKDATRAFVSGDFSPTGLTDDLTGLSHQDYLGIEEWIHFYEKDYQFVGFLSGTYYDASGKPTNKLRAAEKNIAEAKKKQSTDLKDQERFPPCNSEWSSGKGGRVWCTDKSGGISRDWAGVPRKLFKPGSSQSRCACVKNFGPPLDAVAENNEHKNRGDLDFPGLQEYPGCNPSAVSCTNKE